jgi:hypothetical protein
MADAMPRLDKRHLSTAPLERADDEKEYWLRLSGAERMGVVELNRRMIYGDAVASRLQRLLEVAEFPRG